MCLSYRLSNCLTNVTLFQVTAIEPIINHGGASLTTQHLHQCLRWLFGVAVVVTDVGHVLLIDLCLDDLSCNQNEIEASGKLHSFSSVILISREVKFSRLYQSIIYKIKLNTN